MKFDKSRVYTAVNADEVKIGSRGYFCDSLKQIIECVENDRDCCLGEIRRIDSIEDLKRFDNGNFKYALFYLVEKPEEKKYRPYEDTDEMIEDFLERYNNYSGESNIGNPMYNPLVWVKDEHDVKKLATSFGKSLIYLEERCLSLEILFENCTYLDGSPCGKQEEQK